MRFLVACSSNAIISSAKNFPSIRRIDNPVGFDSIAEFLNELLADIPANIRLDEQHFEIVEKFLVDIGAIEELGDFTEDAAPRFLQSLFELQIGFRLAAKHAT